MYDVAQLASPAADMQHDSASCSTDSLLEALVFVARSHGKQASREGLTAGLPLENNRLTPSLVPRAAERIGLEARIIEGPLQELRSHQLPAILLLSDHRACVLLELDAGHARIAGSEAKTPLVSLEELAREHIGSAILLRPIYEFDARAPELRNLTRRHWFWGALAENLQIYRDVLLAAGLINLFALALPLFTKNVYDRVVPNRAVETLWVLASGVLIVLIADFTLRTMRGYFLDLAGKRVDLKLSSFIMERVLGIRLEERPASVGSFAANLRSFESVRDFITSATVTAVIDLPFALLFLLVIGWIAWPMVIPIAIAITVVICYGVLVGSRMHELVEATYRAGAMRTSTLIESLVGLESIKTLGAEGVMQRRWENSAAFLADKGAQLRLLATSTINVATFCQQFIAVSVIIIGVYLISAAELSMGGLIACSMLAARTMAPLGQVAGLLTRYHDALTSLSSLDQIIAKEVERPRGAHFLTRQRLSGEIEFRDVSFSYPETETHALRGLSFRIKAGEKVAILGRSGSGKSTILRLILGLYRPTSGAVLLDGIDIRQLDAGEMRRNVGYVPQHVTLFYGTLRDNITMGAPFAEDADILSAAEVGNITEFVNLHPRGFDMQVGERGETLSGGQREGVAIARAVINKPPILLLDEPTGSMDHSGEEAVKSKLRNLLPGRSLVLVTHRTSLLDLVDRIIVTDQGKIVADGPKASVIEALRQGRVGKAS